jgi:hypothetical protein
MAPARRLPAIRESPGIRIGASEIALGGERQGARTAAIVDAWTAFTNCSRRVDAGRIGNVRELDERSAAGAVPRHGVEIRDEQDGLLGLEVAKDGCGQRPHALDQAPA